MPCLVAILALSFPRLVLAVLYFFTSYISRAYDGMRYPLLGFLFVPLTTLAYAWMANTGRPVEGINLVIIIVTVLIDLGSLGGSRRRRRRE
jgi:hypothetical protein